MSDSSRGWIKHVFVDNELICGMWQDSLQSEIAAWRQDAAAFLKKNGSDGDHVIYCTVKYDDNGGAEYANFCIDLLNDEAYRKRLELSKDVQIWAVHTGQDD